ncbi:MAG: SocA family protein [Bacteroidales bacterium]|nr:SocA family protein [Bacteroidales bacterium]
MRYSALWIANYFLDKAFREGVEMTPMKLVKMVYLAHGWNMAITNNPLINEQVHAWRYGPVIRSVYDTYKVYGSNQIRQIFGNPSPDLDPDTRKVLDKVWEVYKKYDGLQLSTLTHETGSPWEKSYNGERDTPIPDNVIQEFYQNL